MKKTLGFLFSSILFVILAHSQIQPILPTPPRTLDLNKVVGTTPWSYSVSPLGEASYSIPVFCPPGTNGIEPSLSIEYSSFNGLDLFRYGWGLAGLSSITRGNQNYFDDEIVKSVDLTNNDVFYLDGNRLIPVSGYNGYDGTTYASKSESFSLITSYGTAGSGPSYFIVQTKEGLTFEYGNTAGSKVEALPLDDSNPNGTVRTWLLNKVTDQNGNYMTYDYYESASGSYIKDIKYTGNGVTQSTYNEIRFIYKTDYYNINGNVFYEGGSPVPFYSYVESIEVFNQNNLIKSYNFIYDNVNFKLQEIVESDNTGNSYNSIYIVWDEKSYGESDLAVEEISQFSAAADVNNDGKSDIFSIENNTISLYISDFDSFDEYNYSNISISGTVTNVFSIDDNSGKEDILVVSAYQSTYYAYRFVYDVVNELFNYTCFATCSSATQNPLELFMGDFTGNGEQEMYWVDIVTGNVICSDFIPAQDFPTNQIINSYESQPVDFSGNGKTDIFAFTAYPAKVYVYEYGTTFQQTDVLDLPLPSSRGYHTGDFNGDGKTDMLMFYNNNTYVIHLSTGRKLLNEPMEVAGPGSYIWSDQNIIAVRDFTGDGKDDLLMLEITQIDALRFNHTYRVFSLKHHYIEYDNGDFPFAEFVETNTIELQFVQTSEPVLFGDFNGDGKCDIFMEYQGFTGMPGDPVPFSFAGVLYMNENNKEMFVQSVYDGFNNFVEFDYISIANDRDYTAQEQTAPFYKFLKPFWVVKSTSFQNNQDVLVNQYTYTNGISHKHLGFLGFENTTKTSPLNIESEIVYDYSVVSSSNNNFLLISEISSQVSDMNQPVLLYSSDYENSHIFYNNGKTLLQTIESKTNYDYVKGNKIVSEMEYFTTGGNLDNVTTTFYTLGNTNPVHTSLQEYTYSTFGSWHVPSRVSSITTTQTRQGQQSYVREVNYSYDSYGKMTQSVLDPGKSGAQTITYSNFSVHGLPRSVNLSGGSLTRSASVDYDSKGRFVVSETNPLQQTKTQTWNEAWGVVTSETDINGLTSTAQYDGFGRMTNSANPYGTSTTISLGWADEITPLTGARYWVLSETTQSPYVKMWFDNTQRKIREQTQSYSGVVFSDFEYNENGFLYRSCLPTYSTINAKWTEYSYDYLGRIIEEQHQDLDPTTYYYDNNSITVTDPGGRQRTATYDPTGLLVESEEPESGTVTYSYNSMNKPINIISNGSTLSMVYDDYARQTELSDPNSGTTTFAYNALGELISQTDANTCITTFQYNAMGAPTQKSSSVDGTTTFTYNTSGAAINLPCTIQGPQATYSFTYDNLGRILTRSLIIPSESKTFVEQYAYDSYSRVNKFTYPSGFAIKYDYTSTGYLNAIRKFSDNSLIWQATNRNELNMPISNMLGNGVEEKFSWDQYYQLTRLRYFYTDASSMMSGMNDEQQSLTETTTTYFDMSYSFNPETGNLTSRTNNKRTLTETFTYDNLDRLVNFQIGSNNFPMEYSVNGNLEEKFDAGVYAYATKPHAVDEIVNTDGSIPTTTQNISYNSFNKATSISEGYRNAQFKYAPDDQRCVMKTYNTQNQPPALLETRYYFGNYEEVPAANQPKRYHYIYSPDGLVSIYYTAFKTTKMYYAAKDHLGSICMLIDQSRVVVDERSFDAWGRNRNPVNWTYTSVPAMLITNRGYTTHEHLPDFKLINMNGRLYDPVVGRMLNADPFVSDFTSSQNYNRYSYVNNNPLRYTDPSGYIPWPRIFRRKNVPMYDDGSCNSAIRTRWTLGMASGSGNNAEQTNEFDTYYYDYLTMSTGNINTGNYTSSQGNFEPPRIGSNNSQYYYQVANTMKWMNENKTQFKLIDNSYLVDYTGLKNSKLFQYKPSFIGNNWIKEQTEMYPKIVILDKYCFSYFNSDIYGKYDGTNVRVKTSIGKNSINYQLVYNEMPYGNIRVLIPAISNITGEPIKQGIQLIFDMGNDVHRQQLLWLIEMIGDISFF